MIAEHGPLQECIYLASCGVPWDVVIALDEIERRGFCIAAGTSIEGGEFNWSELKWIKRNA